MIGARTVPVLDVTTLLEQELEPWPRVQECWLLAFSGGGDSLALALHLRLISKQRGISLELVTVDHGLDPESSQRALRASELARALGLHFTKLDGREEVGRLRGLGPEQAARIVRYRLLEYHRAERGASRIITAHHADDLAETVLIRIRRRTGVRGLGGMENRRGFIWRPALQVRRHELREILNRTDNLPIDDPSNRDPRQLRARLRRWLEAQGTAGEELIAALCQLSQRAWRVRKALPRRLEQLAPDLVTPFQGLAIAHLHSLPFPVQAEILAEFWARLLPEIPTPGPARLGRFLAALRAGTSRSWSIQHWRWVVRGKRLFLEPAQARPRGFAYSVVVPGRLPLPELGSVLSLRWGDSTESWIYRGHPQRAALGVWPEAAKQIEIRTPLVGDRLRPIGTSTPRKVTSLFRDRKVPGAQRSQWPLLAIAGQIAWIPGVAIEDTFRVRDGVPTLIAEFLTTEPQGSNPKENT